MIVVDASVMATSLRGERRSSDAVLTALLTEDGPLHAPEIIELELLQTLRRYVRAGLTPAEAQLTVEDLAEFRLERHPHEPLTQRVWALRDRLTAYDAAYVALAEQLGADLITADRGMAAVARDVLGASRVQEVGARG